MRIYLAGPMRGIPYFNFPAFDTAAEQLRGLGHTVTSPAELDRAQGFDEFKHPLGQLEESGHVFDLQAARSRDIRAIEAAEALCLLPGWADSIGATAERAYALWAQKEVRTLHGLLIEPQAQIKNEECKTQNLETTHTPSSGQAKIQKEHAAAGDPARAADPVK